MGSRNQTVVSDLTDDRGKRAAGKLIVRGEEVAGERGKDMIFL